MDDNDERLARAWAECDQLEKAIGLNINERTVCESLVSALYCGRKYPVETTRLYGGGKTGWTESTEGEAA